MKTYRAGIIGCGKIASGFADDPKMAGDIFTHAEAYSKVPNTELAAICDSDPAQLTKCGQRWGVGARYTELGALLEGQHLDILSICTPDQTHYAVIKEILLSPSSIRAILSEKPLAMTVAQAQELVDLASEKNIILAVVYMRRFAENFRSLKELLVSGVLGEIQAVSGWYTKGVRHNGTHWFDQLRYLVGEVKWVCAWNECRDDEMDPTLDVVLGLENGGIATLRACDASSFTIFEMEILGRLGRIRLLDSGFEIEYSQAVDSQRYTGYKELEVVPFDFGNRKNLMLYAIQDLVMALETGKSVACSGEDGVAVLKVADAALESTNVGRAIYIR
jgi:predicted dehydrogenase